MDFCPNLEHLNKARTKKNPNTTIPHVSFEASEMARLEQGLWLTQARVFSQQKFMAEDHPLTLSSQDSHSSHKTKKQKKWGTGFSNKNGKKAFQGSRGSSSEKVKIC